MRMVRQLLAMTCATSICLGSLQLALELGPEEALQAPARPGNGTAAAGAAPRRAGASPEDDRGAARPSGGDPGALGSHAMAQLAISLGLAMAGVSAVGTWPLARPQLVTFACLTFLIFAADLATLMRRVEAPPGAIHLLSFKCMRPADELTRYVQGQQQRMHSHLAAGVPGGARLLKPPPSLDRDGKGSAADWPLVVPRGSLVDLCSPARAVGNAHLMLSGSLVLLLHAGALKLLRLTGEPSLGLALHPGRFDIVRGAEGRVDIVLDATGATEATPSRRRSRSRSRREFVPFEGRPRTLA